MPALLPAVLLTLFMSLSAEAQGRRLAVFSRPTQSFEGVLSVTIQSELQRLLTPAGIDVVWMLSGKSEAPEEFDLLVVGSFSGACSVEELPVTAVSARTIMLGETQLSSNGRVLPFFTVDCARLVRTLTPTLGRLSVPLRHVVFGRALARVIAHEIYHILAQAMTHDDLGVAKPSFSLGDLTAERFEFASASLGRMRPPAPSATNGRVGRVSCVDNWIGGSYFKSRYVNHTCDSASTFIPQSILVTPSSLLIATPRPLR